MFFIIEEGKEAISDFSHNFKSIVNVVVWRSYKVSHNFFLPQYSINMVQYNTLNVKLSNLQLNKTKSGIKKK